MSDDITSTDQIRMLCNAIDNDHTTSAAAITILIRAVRALCDALDAHQHSYYGAPGLNGAWATTQPQRDTTGASHLAHMKRLADKKKR